MNLIFTCGGTAGHINPAIAVANMMKERYPDSNILFIGATGHMEEKLIPQAGFEVKCLPGSGLSRKLNLAGIKKNLHAVKCVLDAVKTCKKIFKQYYWERKPFDDIADSIGYGTIDSVKTKKSKCMKQFKDFAKKLLDNDEFAEEVVRATVERAALRELINEERVYAETDVTMAALDIEDESDDTEK